MKYLVDTQVFIWSLISPDKLSAAARHALQNGTVFISVVSLFEISIKQKIGKLPELPVPIADIVDQIMQDGFELLPLATTHIAHYNEIQLRLEHRDPFDRLLLAIALSEHIPLISADGHFKSYSDQVDIVW